MRMTSARTNCAASAQPTQPSATMKPTIALLPQGDRDQQRQESCGTPAKAFVKSVTSASTYPPRQPARHAEYDGEQSTKQQRE